SIENSTGCSGLDRERVRVAHLSENLRFADYHRVERRCHGEHVAHRVFVRVTIEILIEETRGQATRRDEEVRELSRPKLQLLGRSCTENLDAVTSRNDQAFAHDLAVDEMTQTRRARLVVERESFADLYRSCFVIDSDEKYGHSLNRLLASTKNVIAPKQRGAEESTKHENKSDHAQPCCSSSTPVCARAIDDQEEIEQPRQHGKNLFRIVVPELARARSRPDHSGRDAECEQRESESGRVSCQFVDRRQRG